MSRVDQDTNLFDKDPVAIAEMILLLRRKGVRDRRTVAALERVPRRLFLPSERHQFAYRDRPQPIECGQTVLAPSTVGLMVEALFVENGHRVLHIGTGSGYQAAVLASMGAKVFTVERYAGLVALAKQRFAALRLRDISVRCGDGLEGWPDQRRFDRIILAGCVPKVPTKLLRQLAAGGLLLAPIGGEGMPQPIVRFEGGENGLTEHPVAVGRFTPLMRGCAQVL